MPISFSRLFRLRGKLFLVALTPLCMLIAVAGIGLSVVEDVRRDVEAIVNASLPATTCDMILKTQSAMVTTEQAQRDKALAEARAAAEVVGVNRVFIYDAKSPPNNGEDYLSLAAGQKYDLKLRKLIEP